MEEVDIQVKLAEESGQLTVILKPVSSASRESVGTTNEEQSTSTTKPKSTSRRRKWRAPRWWRVFRVRRQQHMKERVDEIFEKYSRHPEKKYLD
eukprot:5562604-Pyramimonas_sp.AAC.1